MAAYRRYRLVVCIEIRNWLPISSGSSAFFNLSQGIDDKDRRIIEKDTLWQERAKAKYWSLCKMKEMDFHGNNVPICAYIDW